MQTPKISVIMAVRNMEATLPNTLDALLNQTFKDFEIVVTDDASEDGTTEILEEYSKKDSRISFVKNSVRKERCFSRNIAIERSKGKYIAVTDGDDFSFPERLEKEYEYLENNPDVYLVGSRAHILDEAGRNIGKSWGKKEDVEITEVLREKNVLVHSSVMFRNTKEFKYREKFKYAQDYDLFLQIIKKGYKVSLLGDFLVSYTDKKDLVFSDYVVKQTYFSEIARGILREEIMYEDFDVDNLEKYVPERLVLEMKLKENFTNGKFKESREYSKKLIKKDSSLWWKLYFVDSYFKGSLIKMGKRIKRSVI